MYIYVFIYLSYNREAVTMYSLHEDDLRRQFDVDYCIFENLRWLRLPTYRIFFNFAKSCILSCLSNVVNTKRIHRAVFEL